MAIGKVTKTQAKLRMAISGPSGAGKTYSALEIATAMGGKVCLFDTEYGSAAKYADHFDFDGDMISGDYHPENYVKRLHEAEKLGYDIIIFDSLTHAWNGPGGVLELVNAATKRKGGNSYAAWDDVTPIYRNLIHSIMASPAHVIVTLRAKQDYVQEKDANGRTQIRKVGMAPEIREGFSYEMDIEGLLDIDHNFIIGKTRCDALDGKVFHKPGKDLADILVAWLTAGAPAPAVEPTPVSAAQTPTPVDPKDPWAGAAEWCVNAKNTMAEWGISFGELPFIKEMGAPTARLSLQAWAISKLDKDTDPYDAFVAEVRKWKDEKAA